MSISSKLHPRLDETPSPWYREFWAWFVFAPLIIVVIACTITVSIAVIMSDDVVVDNYYKEGKALNQDFGPQDQARQLNVQADLQLNRSDRKLLLNINQRMTKNLSLILTLSHPLVAEKDQTFIVPKLTDEQIKQMPLVLDISLETIPEGRWYLRLSAFDDLSNKEFWRVQSEVDFSAVDSSVLH